MTKKYQTKKISDKQKAFIFTINAFLFVKILQINYTPGYLNYQTNQYYFLMLQNQKTIRLSLPYSNFDDALTTKLSHNRKKRAYVEYILEIKQKTTPIQLLTV